MLFDDFFVLKYLNIPFFVYLRQSLKWNLIVCNKIYFSSLCSLFLEIIFNSVFPTLEWLQLLLQTSQSLSFIIASFRNLSLCSYSNLLNVTRGVIHAALALCKYQMSCHVIKHSNQHYSFSDTQLENLFKTTNRTLTTFALFRLYRWHVCKETIHLQ